MLLLTEFGSYKDYISLSDKNHVSEINNVN